MISGKNLLTIMQDPRHSGIHAVDMAEGDAA